jgi:hypothetical protein
MLFNGKRSMTHEHTKKKWDQKASIIDTVVTAFQKTVFFNHKYYPSMKRVNNTEEWRLLECYAVWLWLL